MKRGVLLLSSLLILSSCGIKKEEIPAASESSATSAASNSLQMSDLKSIISEESAKIDKNFANNPDYIIWKTNNNYSGSWREENKLKIGYIEDNSKITSQSLISMQNTADKVFKEEVSSAKKFKNGLGFGNAILAQQVITRASVSGIIPRLNGVGYTPSLSTLKLLINDKNDIPRFKNILNLLNIDENSVIFEINKLVPLSDLISAAAVPDKTGNSPLRAGSFIKTDADSCTVGGFVTNPTGKLGFITALHCFKTRNAAVTVKMNGDGTVVGSATRFSGDIDAAYVQITTTSYNNIVINGTPRAYVQGDTAGTTVSSTESDPWREINSVSEIYGNIQAHGGMTGLSNIKSNNWTYFTSVVFKGATGDLISNVMCTYSPKVNTYKGDSGSPATDDKKNTIGIMQSVSETGDANNNFTYCIVGSGEIKRSLNVTL